MDTLDVYYPQHFKKTRPYIKSFMEQLAELEAAKRLNPELAFKAASNGILTWYRATGVQATAPDFDIQLFSKENQAALMYGEWAAAGAAVYAFEPPLVEALSATGVGDVAISDLNFPFNCAYFHFGPQPDLVLQSGAPVTGAYVLMTPGKALRICLTAPITGELPPPLRAQELYDLRILSEHFGKDIESAITHALADDIEDLRQALVKINKAQAHRESGAAAANAFLEAHTANQDVFSRCFQLIANGLCYVTAYPEDADIQWQRGTPEKLKMKADTAYPKEAGRAASRLNAMGYRKIKYIGAEFCAAAQQAEAGHMSPHWRRGHWRRQAHGPSLSLRKLIWLKPTRVLGSSVSDEARVYAVVKTER